MLWPCSHSSTFPLCERPTSILVVSLCKEFVSSYLCWQAAFITFLQSSSPSAPPDLMNQTRGRIQSLAEKKMQSRNLTLEQAGCSYLEVELSRGMLLCAVFLLVSCFRRIFCFTVNLWSRETPFHAFSLYPFKYCATPMHLNKYIYIYYLYTLLLQFTVT